MTPRDDRKLAELIELLGRAQGETLKRLSRELADDDRVGVRKALDGALARERARNREQARLKRLYALEAQLRSDGYRVVAGIDEVGRGALAGPLSAGACILPDRPRIKYLNDSKMLTPARREVLAAEIKSVALGWSVAHVPASDVDALGMTAALKRVMRKALEGLSDQVDHVVVDGRPLGLVESETAVVGGDGKVAAIAAASILAKVTRDRLMAEMASLHPGYGFEINKGYSTPEHIASLDVLGLCPEHRRSFMPCGGTERLF